MDGVNETPSDSDSSTSWIFLNEKARNSGEECQDDTSSSSEVESDTDGISIISENEPLEERTVLEEISLPAVTEVVLSSTKEGSITQAIFKQFGLGVLFVALLYGSLHQCLTQPSFDNLKDVPTRVTSEEGILEHQFDKVVDLAIFCTSRHKKNSQIKQCVRRYLNNDEPIQEESGRVAVEEQNEAERLHIGLTPQTTSFNEEVEVKFIKKAKQVKKGYKQDKDKNKKRKAAEWDAPLHKSRNVPKFDDSSSWMFDRAFVRCKKRKKTFWQYEKIREQVHNNPSFKLCSS